MGRIKPGNYELQTTSYESSRAFAARLGMNWVPGGTKESDFTWHCSRAVANVVSGTPALPHIRESIRLNLNDPQSREFLAFIEKQISASSPP